MNTLLPSHAFITLGPQERGISDTLSGISLVTIEVPPDTMKRRWFLHSQRGKNGLASLICLKTMKASKDRERSTLGSGLPSLGRLGVVYPRSEAGTTIQSTGRGRRKRSVSTVRNGRNGLATLSPRRGSLRPHKRIKGVGGTNQEESVSCVWAFASVGLHVATLNVQGGLSVYSPGVSKPLLS